MPRRNTKGATTPELIASIKSRIRARRTIARELTYLARKARLARIKQEGLTAEDGWSIYCSGDPLPWTAHWFNLTQGAVKRLQSPNTK